MFDKFYKQRSITKNISSPEQLQHLTKTLQKYSNKPLLISTDQEGGKVARLKPSYGFTPIPSAQKVGTMSPKQAQEIYTTQAKKQGLEEPVFATDNTPSSNYKTIDNQKLKRFLDYEFIYSDLLKL